MLTKKYNKLNPTGRIRAEQIVKKLERAGRQARIREVWHDRERGITIENILIYDASRDHWYQALTPRMFSDLNAGRTFDIEQIDLHA